MPSVKVPPFNSTLMGIIRGIADCYGLPFSDARLFGLSGHAFMINIHDSLCPSGPYCWNRKPFYDVLQNIGIRMDEGPFYDSSTSLETRNQVDAALISQLDRGDLCGLVNLEYQLITGYDSTGFTTTRPWPYLDFPPDHLTFSSWQEFGSDVFVSFFTFEQLQPAPEKDAVIDGLQFALAVHNQPQIFSKDPYHAGLFAYDAWIRAVDAGHGASHGNWWNGLVWGECRHQASQFFGELKLLYPFAANLSGELQAGYRLIADLLLKVAEKELATAQKTKLLREAKEQEKDCLAKISLLIDELKCEEIC